MEAGPQNGALLGMVHCAQKQAAVCRNLMFPGCFHGLPVEHISVTSPKVTSGTTFPEEKAKVILC